MNDRIRPCPAAAARHVYHRRIQGPRALALRRRRAAGTWPLPQEFLRPMRVLPAMPTGTTIAQWTPGPGESAARSGPTNRTALRRKKCGAALRQVGPPLLMLLHTYLAPSLAPASPGSIMILPSDKRSERQSHPSCGITGREPAAGGDRRGRALIHRALCHSRSCHGAAGAERGSVP